MKITFISLGISTDAIGPRILSSLLKQNSHESQLIFLPTLKDIQRRATHKAYQYSVDIINQLIDLCKDSDLIGLSIMTHHYSIAVNLTLSIKEKISTPVIWGGIHPTVTPEECLKTADMVCIGDGENSIIELAERMETGQDVSDIQGIWVNKDTTVVKNGAGRLVEDLDSLPFPDYSFEDHHLLMDDTIVPMTPENWRQHLVRFFPPLNRGNPDRPAYQVLSARGCPFNCTFCGEVPLTEKIYNRHYFRKRSIKNLIEELVWVKKTFSFIGEICFCDDTFPSRTTSEIREFSRQYKEKIGFSFYILVSPANVIREKFDLLVDAGLTNIGMGIQSGSSRIIDLYKRDKVGNVKQALKAAHIINSYKGLMPFYDFIVENPFETREDLLDTIRLLIALPRPYETRAYALSFFPGTPLYDKALADGILHADLRDKTFGQRTHGSYLELIVDMNMYKIPQALLKLMISKPFLFCFNQPLADRFFLNFHQFLKWMAMKLHFNASGLS